jgi:hypothetical protein
VSLVESSHNRIPLIKIQFLLFLSLFNYASSSAQYNVKWADDSDR